MPTGGTVPNRCFIAMPITTRESEIETYGNDADHWAHVRESLFVPAIETAGFDPIRAGAKGAWLIHDMIVRHLEEADLVLVDLSAHNPNVFFELGVRTSLNKPIALVWDKLTSLPFDTSGINTHAYDPTLAGWSLDEQRQELAAHIRDSAESCGGQNPLWQRFGLQSKASEPVTDATPESARLELLANELAELRSLVSEMSQTAYDPASERGSDVGLAANPSSKDMEPFRRQLEVALGKRIRRLGLGLDYRVSFPTDDRADPTAYLTTSKPLPVEVRQSFRALGLGYGLFVVFSTDPAFGGA